MAGGFPLSARHELLLNRYCVLRDAVNDALEHPLSVTVGSILRAGLTGDPEQLGAQWRAFGDGTNDREFD